MYNGILIKEKLTANQIKRIYKDFIVDYIDTRFPDGLCQDISPELDAELYKLGECMPIDDYAKFLAVLCESIEKNALAMLYNGFKEGIQFRVVTL